MSIILIRHGETALNAARVLQPADTPLSDRGRRQAEAVAMRLANAKAGRIISSDLTRAMQTAETIALRIGLAIGYSALLQERNYGDLRGCAYDGLGFDPVTMEQAPPAGESMAEFRSRVAQGLALMCQSHAATEGDLVVVTHGFFIRTLLQQHLALAEGIDAPQRIGNTSVTVFCAEPPHRVTDMNNIDHLSFDLSDDVQAVSGL